ncbi:MAG: glycosyltransferase [Nitriliruptorales bacterium]|nr:glycosyltransferase [Nitriliruptorales bacterium]
MRPIRLGLYGDVDLNILDGSAIWLASLADVLAGHPRVELTVLLKAEERRDLITAGLRGLDRVRLTRPDGAGARLSQREAVSALTALDRTEPFHAVILRGLAVSREAADSPLAGKLWCYLTDVPQRRNDVDEPTRRDLEAIATTSDRLLCQTEELRAYLEGVVPEARGRTLLLPPMVPPTFASDPHERPTDRGFRLFYAGKFAPLWGFLETVAAFRELQRSHPDLEFHVAGDKIHNPPDDLDFKPAVESALRSGNGLVWHGACTREEVAELLTQVDLALSARDRQMSDSLELSTKLLEYGAAGVPVVMNRTEMHERLYGQDYPLFIDGLDDLPAALAAGIVDADAWVEARDRATSVAGRFSYGAVRQDLSPALERLAPRAPFRSRRVLVAGHDLKFFVEIQRHLERAGADVRIDPWEGHKAHDEPASRDALEWADTIICEWCLGNAVWYSQRRRDDQQLIVRFHRQELETEFPPRIDPDRIDRFVFVSDRIRREANQRFGWNAPAEAVIPNTVDTHAFDRPKLRGAPRNLALVGYVPRLKGLRRALDILVELRRHDLRYRLFLAGHLPWQKEWVWNRASERDYFSGELDRIRSHRLLRNAVSFDGHVQSVASWLPKIGVILSMSDLESFHLGLAEGMASRAAPLIRGWTGAKELYPDAWIHEDPVDAAHWLLEHTGDDVGAAGEAARGHIVANYDLQTIAARWTELALR